MGLMLHYQKRDSNGVLADVLVQPRAIDPKGRGHVLTAILSCIAT